MKEQKYLVIDHVGYGFAVGLSDDFLVRGLRCNDMPHRYLTRERVKEVGRKFKKGISGHPSLVLH